MTEQFTDYVRLVCKIGQGADCCKFLTMGADGFECAKGTGLEVHIILRGDTMRAQGDNCDGRPPERLNRHTKEKA